MHPLKLLTLSLIVLSVAAGCQDRASSAQSPAPGRTRASEGEPKAAVTKSEAEWRKQLSEEEFYVLRRKGTERAFTGAYWNEKAEGTYHCRGCEVPLFTSSTKFKSGTGWPSFTSALPERVREERDSTHGMVRREILCQSCGGHLGHVFSDGPKPTGLRYCVNSASLKLVKTPE